jgi:hypothetical protein
MRLVVRIGENLPTSAGQSEKIGARLKKPMLPVNIAGR